MKRTTIGGQALIEGVMMKNQDQYATAVRKPDGTIDVAVEPCISLCEKYHLNKVPIIRGVFNFIDSMVVGIKTLTYSASFYEDEEEAAKEKEKESKFGEKLLITGTIIFSLIFSLIIFLIIPNLITNLLRHYTKSEVLFSLVEGILRLAIFVIYVLLISKMEDIKRVFMYHGAEHKTINCLEHGDPLTPENVLKHARYHKRCGTSFMIIVMIVSIVFFMFIHIQDYVLRIVFRILLVPVIAGISYELIRFAGRYDNLLVRIISKPGFWVQALTTKEPDEKMAEVAIASVAAVFDWEAYQEAMRNGEIED